MTEEMAEILLAGFSRALKKQIASGKDFPYPKDFFLAIPLDDDEDKGAHLCAILALDKRYEDRDKIILFDDRSR